MALILNSKRARLIWKEYTDQSIGCNIIPSLSFDGGNSWMDISEEMKQFRDDSSARLSVLDNKIYNSKTSLTEYDISLGFTPYCVPEIVDYKCVETTDQSTVFQNGTTYYFAVLANNFDSPGAEVLGTGLDHIYYDGPVDVNNKLKGLSNLKKVLVPTPNDTTTRFNIELYINYAYFCQGLNIYCGTSPDNLKLIQITNLCQKLKGSIRNGSFMKYIPNTDRIDYILLQNEFPLLKSGTIKIDGEYFVYTNCEYKNWGTEAGECWGLETTNFTRVSTNTSTHEGISSSTPATVYQCVNDGYNGRIPVRAYDYDDTTGMLEYINFNSEAVIDMVDNHANEKGITKEDGSVTTSNYGIYDSLFGVSYKSDGSTVIETGLDLANYKTGSIHFYYHLDGFNSVDIDDIDPYLFYSELENNQGLYMRISRFNKKIYVGYIKDKDTNIGIFSGETYKLPALSMNDFDSIGLAWDKYIRDDKVECVKFYLHFNSVTNLVMESNIEYKDFNPGKLIMAGKYNANNITHYPIGYLDNVRMYDKNLGVNNEYYYFQIIKNDDGSICELGSIDNIDTQLNQFVMNVKGELKTGYCVPTKYTDSTTSKTYYNKYIYVTSTDYSGNTTTSWKQYSKSMSFTDIDNSSKKDTTVLAGKLILGTNLKDLEGYESTVHNQIKGSVTTGTLYEPRFHTLITDRTEADVSTDISSIAIKYDKWLIDQYLTQETVLAVDSITYPVKSTLFQVKYILEGQENGFTTPFLFNPSTIISEVKIG